MSTAAEKHGVPAVALAEAPRRDRDRRTLPPIGVGLLVIGAVLMAMLPLVVRRVGDADYWWHVTTARWIIEHHALPIHDLYTYTVPDHVWTDHEYLSELLIYALGRIGGQFAVSVGLGLITWAGFWLILARTNLRRSPWPATAGALALAVVAGVAVWGPRPQMITFALVCLELYLLNRYLDGDRRALYVMPPLVALWANLHGGFVIAFLFLAIAFVVTAGRWLRDRGDLAARAGAVRVALVGAACVIAGLLNPHGLSLYVYSWRTQTSAVQQAFIREWQSPDFHNPEMRGLEAMLVLLIVGLALRRTRVGAFDLLVAFVGLLLALQSVRHIAIFVATATPLLAWVWAPSLLSLRERAPRWAARVNTPAPRLLAAVLVAAVAVSAASLVTVRSLLAHQAASTRDNYPAGAANYLDAHSTLGTRMFSDYAWGGYMAYRFFPQQNRRVFLFGEADLMGDRIMNDYVDIVQLHSNWLDLLNHYAVDYVVFEPNSSLTSALATQSSWHRVYADPVAVIYARGAASG